MTSSSQILRLIFRMKLNNLLTIGLLGLVSLLSGCASVSRQSTNVYPEAKPDKGLGPVNTN